jgi:hypothetical protein
MSMSIDTAPDAGHGDTLLGVLAPQFRERTAACHGAGTGMRNTARAGLLQTSSIDPLSRAKGH